jgi:tetratricopeptide (TPR) repeat protein
MSLLIKALDHLDKKKKTEKDKKQTGEYVADGDLLLELVPVEQKDQLVLLNNEVAPSVADIGVKVENIQLKLDREMTLEEEAGLSGASFSANKNAKPRPANKATNKSAIETKPIKNSSQEVLQPSNVKIKTATSNQVSAFQTINDKLNQNAAAKVFAANKKVNVPSSKFVLISLGIVGALLVLLGLQGYEYIKRLDTHEAVVLKSSGSKITQVTNVRPDQAISSNTIPPAEVPTSVHEHQSAYEVSAIDSFDSKKGTSAFKIKEVDKSNVVGNVLETESKNTSTKEMYIKKANKNNDNHTVGEDADYAESGNNKNQKSVTLISKVQSQGVDPTLQAAYQAFTRGEDMNAQHQYRQVLQSDVRNVDALLGMAAIAQRQGRDADAQGWYQKVLEIDPRNSIAQTAIVSPQANTDLVGTESRIKNMIAQTPEGANLHAALGNLYAEQNQWPSAQEAYFNASRLSPNNADYAFNLAISLDQMGKSSLALKQYQRALDLLNKSGGTSPDREQLESRIRELQ